MSELTVAGTGAGQTPSAITLPGFRALFDALPQGALVIDRARRIVLANLPACELFGYDADSLVGCAMDTLVPSALRNHHENMVDRYFRMPSTQAMGTRTEFPALRRDGTQIYVEIGLSPIETADGTAVLATFVDATERMQNQEALRRSDERLRLALASAKLGAWEWHVSSDAVYWSPECVTMLGPENAVITLNEFLEKIVEEDRALAAKSVSSAFSSRQPYHAEFRMRTGSGEVRWFSARGSSWFDPRGNVVRMAGTLADVTDRKAIDEELRQSRSRLLAALEVGGVGTWEWDAINDRITVDEPGARLWGRRIEDLNQKPLAAILERIHPDDIASIMGQTEEVFSGKRQAISVDVRLLQDDGQYGWVRSAGRVEFGPDNVPLRVTGANVDITRYKTLERLLRASEEQFALVFESSPLPSILADEEDQRIVAVNDAMCSFLNISREEMLGRRPGDAAGLTLEVRQLIREALQAHGFLKDFEFTYKPFGSDEDRWALLTVTKLSVQGHEHHLFVAADITERKRTELDLVASQQRFRELAETINEVFWLTDVDGDRIIYLSPAFEVVWGRSPAALYANPREWQQSIHPDDREIIVRAAYEKQASGTYDEQYRILRPDGEVRWIRDRAFPVTDVDGKVVRIAGVAEDITERLNLERQLRQTQKMESVGELAGGVAHDFNNWLTVISSYTDFIEPMLAGNLDAKEFLGEIRIATERAASLTRQLLAFSRQEVLEPRVLDLNTAVIDTEKMLGRLLGEDVVVKLNLAQRLSRIRVDPGHLVQVLMNLAVNGRDAMPRGGVLHIRTRNTAISADMTAARAGVEPGEYVELSVTDTGIGMSEETMARIFEPFFTTKGAGKGTGLGLAVVHGIIEQSGGHISVDSKKGSGTTFTVVFPALQNAATHDEVHGHAPPRTLAGTETVLLVEDEESVRRVVNRALTSRGYTVLTALEGAEAISIVESHPGPIHLLLTDVVMPGMDGREVAELVEQRQPGIKVLYSSGYTDDAVLRHGLKHSDIHFLQKPYTMDELLRMVRSVIDS